MTDSLHRLTLGSLTLSEGVDYTGDPSLPYRFDVLGEDFDRGEPVPVEVTLRTLLQDGARVAIESYDNRTASFRVTVTGDDSAGLAAGEAALVAELGGVNELTWTPPDGFGAPTVFEVLTSTMGPVEDDLAELLRTEATYALTLTCHPFAASVDEVVAPATSAPSSNPAPVTTTINAGDSTTGWTATSGTLTDAGSYLRVSGVRNPTAVYSTTVDLTSTPYVSLLMRVDHNPSGSDSGALPAPPTLEVRVSGSWVSTELVGKGGGTGGFGRWWWRVPAGTLTGFRFTAGIPISDRLAFSTLVATNYPPYSGTTRQKQMTAPVVGSARTQGSLSVAATTGLGSVLLYSRPDDPADYTPSLRPRRVSGGTTTADSSLVSGARDNIDTPVVFEYPVRDLVTPQGQSVTHDLMALVRSNVTSPANQTINWSAQVFIGGVGVSTVQSGASIVRFGSTNWRIAGLGRFDLRAGLASNTTAVLRVTIAAADAAVSNIDLDEAWIFNSTVGRLTWVDCGSSTRMWVDSATTLNPRPGVFVGNQADRSDSYTPGTAVRAWTPHEFRPPLVSVFSVTTGALDAGVALTHRPRWHTRAGQ